MFDVTGKISDLFSDMEGHITYRLCDTMINKPITDSKGKVLGTIVDYDLEQDIWYGVLYKEAEAEYTVKNKVYECVGIVIK